MTDMRAAFQIFMKDAVNRRFGCIAAVSTIILCLFGELTGQSFDLPTGADNAFIRLAGVITTLMLLGLSVLSLWRHYRSRSMSRWWDLGGNPEAPTWLDVLKITVGKGTDDPITHTPVRRPVSWQLDITVGTLIGIYLCLAVEAFSIISRNRLLNIFRTAELNDGDFIKTNANLVMNFSGNLTAFLALIAAIASIYFTYRQLQAKVKADSRQAWIDQLRGNIARFISLVDQVHYAPKSTLLDEDNKNLTECRIEMEMMLNPSERDHRLLMFLTLKLAFFQHGQRHFWGVQDVQNIDAAIRDSNGYTDAAWFDILAPIPPRSDKKWEADYGQLVGYIVRLSHVVLKREWERVKATR